MVCRSATIVPIKLEAKFEFVQCITIVVFFESSLQHVNNGLILLKRILIEVGVETCIVLPHVYQSDD